MKDLLEESFINIMTVDVGRHQGESVVELENHFRCVGAGGWEDLKVALLCALFALRVTYLIV